MDKKKLTRDDMIKTIEMLAGSQGFYGRLLNGLSEADKDDMEAFWQEAEGQGFTDAVDFIMWLEG